MKNIQGLMLLGCSSFALASCGPNELASPGTGGNVIINNPATPSPSPTPTPTPGAGLVTPAAGCPTITASGGLGNEGTISGPTGEYRVCTLPARIDADTTLPYIQGVLYRMNGRVDVGTDGGPVASANDTDVTLTIEPGVIIYSSGSSWLNVNRGNQINAVGTAARPIIFTSRDNVQGLNTDNSSGQWGGVVLSGRAPVTDCIAPNAAPGTVDCERQVEGAVQPAQFGGATSNDSSGRMSYVQIRYSGFVLSGDNELQALTTGGTGTGTQFDHIMSFNSSDDGVEFFGGFVNMKNLIVAGAEDDSLDTDTGVKANLQYVIAVQRPGAGDGVIEADSTNALSEQTPRHNVNLVNATLIQQATSGGHAIRIRGGADYTIANSIVVSPVPCLRLDDTLTLSGPNAAIDKLGPPRFESVALDCSAPFRSGGGGVTEADVAAAFNAGSNNNSDFTNTLTSLFINGSNENAVSAFDPTVLSSFFDAAPYIGAVRNSSDTWYAGWTCNASYANFNGNGNCTSLPVY